MPLYKTVDPVPLSFMRVRLGVVQTGLTVTVKVINVLTGATLLSTITMTEITPGVYSYNWNHSLTALTECVALFTTGGLVYAENFTVDEFLDKQESLASRAT
jgi:hypothetical protein